MAANDTFTGKTPAETYSRIIQINEDNHLLDGVGAEVSPVFKSGAVITGSLNVVGAIYRNGVEVGSSTDSLWSSTAEGKIVRDSDVGIGTASPGGKLEVKSTSTSDDFFLIKKRATVDGSYVDSTVFKVNNAGVMVLGELESPPTAEKGGMYYNSVDKTFYLGVED